MSSKKNEKNNKFQKPEWVPENAGAEFTVKVVKGVESTQEVKATSIKKKNSLSVKNYIEGVLQGDINILARAITLIESNSPKHQEIAKNVIKGLLPKSGNSLRIGITGVPGAGKSTFIEALGMYLIDQGHKVAVLAIDPSSSLNKGSILGDKTRMEKLSREADCFIRPSPSGGTLGGVARKSRETIIACESAGFDVILIETVGVGQSEVTVRSMVDFFLLILISGGGDELQGIKKGVIELADAILINKADGDNESRANIAKSEYSNALHYLKPSTEGWQSNAFTASSLTGKGIKEIWEVIEKFKQITTESKVLNNRRKSQTVEWMFNMIDEELKNNFYNNDMIRSNLTAIKEQILSGKKLPSEAAEILLKMYKD